MTNATSSSSKSNITAKFKSLGADVIMVLGLALICVGVAKFSPAAGLVVTGAILLICAVSAAPGKDKATN